MQTRQFNTLRVDNSDLNPVDFLDPNYQKIWNELSNINESQMTKYDRYKFECINKLIENIKIILGRCHIEYVDYINEQFFLHIKCNDSVVLVADVLIEKQDIYRVLEILTNPSAPLLTKEPVLIVKNIECKSSKSMIDIHTLLGIYPCRDVLDWKHFLSLVGSLKNIVLDPLIAIHINGLVNQLDKLKDENSDAIGVNENKIFMQAKSDPAKGSRLILIQNLLIELDLIPYDFQGEISIYEEITISDESTTLGKTIIKFSSKIDFNQVKEIANQLNEKGLECSAHKAIRYFSKISICLTGKELKNWLVQKAGNDIAAEKIEENSPAPVIIENNNSVETKDNTISKLIIPKITRYETPSTYQIDYWYKNNISVSFTAHNYSGKESIYSGKIKDYEPLSDTVHFRMKYPSVVYLKNVTSYTYTQELDTIFMNADDSSSEKIGLFVGDKMFWVNQIKLSQRLDYFKNMFEKNQNKSSNNIFDLSHQFSVQELKMLLLVVDVENCYVLSLDQAKTFLEIAKKITDSRMINEAKLRIDECRSFTNLKFSFALRKRDYVQCTAMLLSGADINEKLGQLKDNTPLTYAIKDQSGNELVEFLLKNGANTEYFHEDKTPLMQAAFSIDMIKVLLLLNAGASPNTRNASNLTAMHFLFFSSGNKQLARKRQVAGLLIDAGFSGKPSEVTACLKERKCNKFTLNSFAKIWLNKNKYAEEAYIQGATAGALGERLPAELSTYIGSFFGRKDGMNLALVCKAAASLAEEERETALRRRAEKIKDSQPAIKGQDIIDTDEECVARLFSKFAF
jgi:hypothetical protein